MIIFSFLLSTYNKGAIEIHIQAATAMGTLCKSSNSLYPVLFLNERGRL